MDIETTQSIMETNEIDAPKSIEKEYEWKTGNTKEKHQQTTQISDQQREKAHKETPPHQMEDSYENQEEKAERRTHNIYGLLQAPAWRIHQVA